MFLKCSERRKDGKIHRSWSVVESHRYAGGKIAQRHVLYLGEINDSQRLAWERSLAVFDEPSGETRQLALFPVDRTPPTDGTPAVQVRLDALRLEHPRQWGACWLADQLWRTLHLDDFFGARLPISRKDTDWEKVLRVLVIYRLLAPGSEWRLHRHWFSTTALPDLLGVDARAAQDDTLYRCHDLLLPHKEELFAHLRQRWSDLFGARYEVLLYDLTSTYFECDVPTDETDPRRFGHSRDRRGDCVQVVVALVVTPEGLPLAYEMLPGNTADKTTLRDMLATIRRRFGAAERIWIMDRGIPTEEILTELRAVDSGVLEHEAPQDRRATADARRRRTMNRHEQRALGRRRDLRQIVEIRNIPRDGAETDHEVDRIHREHFAQQVAQKQPPRNGHEGREAERHEEEGFRSRGIDAPPQQPRADDHAAVATHLELHDLARGEVRADFEVVSRERRNGRRDHGIPHRQPEVVAKRRR